MARILEHRAKGLMRRAGIPVPDNHACGSAEEARAAAEQIGGKAVVKALVPVGGGEKSAR